MRKKDLQLLYIHIAGLHNHQKTEHKLRICPNQPIVSSNAGQFSDKLVPRHCSFYLVIIILMISLISFSFEILTK